MPDARNICLLWNTGYQHCISVFREWTLPVIHCMKPVKELETLKFSLSIMKKILLIRFMMRKRAFDLELQNFGDKFEIEIFDTLKQF